MKVVKVTWADDHGVKHVRFAGSKKDATALRLGLFEQYKKRVRKSDIILTPTDIPTKKEELVPYLNILLGDLGA